MIYYSAILGWDGIYVILSFFKGWGADPNTYFATTLLQSSDSYMGLLQFIPLIAVAMLVGWIIIWFISHRDLETGLGKVSKLLVPALFVIMIVIVGFFPDIARRIHRACRAVQSGLVTFDPFRYLDGSIRSDCLLAESGNVDCIYLCKLHQGRFRLDYKHNFNRPCKLII